MLTCECDNTAYGVSLIPWDANIRLASPHLDPGCSPCSKGFIAISDGLVPVFDLREELDTENQNPNANTYLLVVSMSKNADARTTMGLLVNTVKGGFNLPPELILNLARSN
jgi:chemotaxis signal transduction protein